MGTVNGAVPEEDVAMIDVKEFALAAGADVTPAVPARFLGAALDSRAVPAGGLFVALRGAKTDGHAYVRKALAAGAGCALVTRAWAAEQPDRDALPLVCADDVRAALAAGARFRRRSLRAKVVGVTGSAGKTTTKEFLAAFLATGGKTHFTQGNFNNDLGLPLTVLGCPSDADYLVLEMGTNHPGEIGRLAAIAEPDAGMVASIGTAHIEFFLTQEGIAREKGTLLAHAREFGVVSASCNQLDVLRGMCRGRFVEVSDPAPFPCPLPGAHNVSNMALAWACAREFGIGADRCARALENFVLPGARWRRVSKDGISFVDDSYNANPTSMIAALDAFASERDAAGPRRGRFVTVLGDMFELGPDSPALHASVKAHAESLGFDETIWVGENFGGIARDEVRALLRPGDTVLLKASHGMELGRVIG